MPPDAAGMPRLYGIKPAAGPCRPGNACIGEVMMGRPGGATAEAATGAPGTGTGTAPPTGAAATAGRTWCAGAPHDMDDGRSSVKQNDAIVAAKLALGSSSAVSAGPSLPGATPRRAGAPPPRPPRPPPLNMDDGDVEKAVEWAHMCAGQSPPLPSRSVTAPGAPESPPAVTNGLAPDDSARC